MCPAVTLYLISVDQFSITNIGVSDPSSITKCVCMNSLPHLKELQLVTASCYYAHTDTSKSPWQQRAPINNKYPPYKAFEPGAYLVLLLCTATLYTTKHHKSPWQQIGHQLDTPNTYTKNPLDQTQRTDHIRGHVDHIRGHVDHIRGHVVSMQLLPTQLTYTTEKNKHPKKLRTQSRKFLH